MTVLGFPLNTAETLGLLTLVALVTFWSRTAYSVYLQLTLI